MSDNQRTGGTRRGNASLKRRATAVSLCVMLSAFAAVAATSGQTGSSATAMSAAPQPAVTATVVAATAAQTNAGETPPASPPATVARHATTRQS